jgi:choline kinase
MRVIIIGAGSATRLGEHTKKLPKGMLDINGKTILERQLFLFKENGIKDIIIITGPHKEKFNLKNVSYIDDLHYEEHDVLGSLMTAHDVMDDELLISYSDILFDNVVLQKVMSSKADIGIAVDLNWEKAYVGRTEHPKSEADNVLINEEKILKIKKNIEPKKNYMLGEFLGLIKFSAKGAKTFVNKYDELAKSHKGTFHEAPSLHKAYLTDMLQELIDSKIDVTPIFIDGKWYEIDTPQDLSVARKLFL